MKDGKINIPDFTDPELQIFREKCNFTPDERRFFELKSKGKSHIQIAFEMHISEATVCRLSKKAKAKIKRIL